MPRDREGQFQTQVFEGYARYEPAVVELRALHESAVRLVSETEPEFLVEALAPGSETTPVPTG